MLNVCYLSRNRPGKRMGMGHYERLLINALSHADSDQRWSFDFVFSGRRDGKIGEWESPIPQLRGGRMLGFSPSRCSGWPWRFARGAVELAEWGRPAVYHSLALDFPAPARRPSVYTIHDLPPARFADEGAVPKWAKQAVAEAAAVHVPSDFAKRELMELLDLPESKIRVIRYGCEHDVFHPGVVPAGSQLLESLGIQGPFLIYVGGFTRRKNVRPMLEAWKEVSPRWPDLELALIGPQEELQAIALEIGAPKVKVVGYLGRIALPSVIKASEFLVCPSIYEGFGLPPLEACALGKPVVSVRAGAIPEVVGEAAVLAEDGSRESLAGAIEKMLDDENLREELARAGPARAELLCWAKHGREMLALYDEVRAR